MMEEHLLHSTSRFFTIDLPNLNLYLQPRLFDAVRHLNCTACIVSNSMRPSCVMCFRDPIFPSNLCESLQNADVGCFSVEACSDNHRFLTEPWSDCLLPPAFSLSNASSPISCDPLGFFGNNLPDGMQLMEDFVSAEEEHILLSWLTTLNYSKLSERRVAHFGHAFDYTRNCASDSSIPIPDAIAFVLRRLGETIISDFGPDQVFSQLGITPFRFCPDNVSINWYSHPDSEHFIKHCGIPPHVDSHTPFTDLIVSLSLGAATVMVRLQDSYRSLIDHDLGVLETYKHQRRSQAQILWQRSPSIATAVTAGDERREQVRMAAWNRSACRRHD